MFPLMKTETRMQTCIVIAIDSIFTPIRNVKISIENFRVEQRRTTKSWFLK